MRALRWIAVAAVTFSWQATAAIAGNDLADPMVRDHREPKTVVVRDHRKPKDVVVRDHRDLPDVIIRDHRQPDVIVHDHRTPPVITTPPKIEVPVEKKTDAGQSSGGVVVKQSTRRPARRPLQPTILLPKFPIKIRL